MSKNNHFFGQPLYGQLSSFHPIHIFSIRFGWNDYWSFGFSLGAQRLRIATANETVFHSQHSRCTS